MGDPGLPLLNTDRAARAPTGNSGMCQKRPFRSTTFSDGCRPELALRLNGLDDG